MRSLEGYVTADDPEAFLDRLDRIATARDATIQALDARYVAGDEHVGRAVACADRAIERDDAIARDRGMEILLYAAGCRQIDDAVGIGIGTGRTPAVVVVDGGDEAGAADAVEALDAFEPAELERGVELGSPERLREWFEIGDAELAATDADLEALVVERVALLTVEK